MTRVCLFATIGALALAALISCSPGASTHGVDEPRPVAPASRAVRVAEALARADKAAQAGNVTDLAQPLAALRASGAHPLDDGARAELAGWQARAPNPGPPMRGRTLGPGYRHGMLDAGGDIRIEQTFLSGQKASIALSSPDDAQLRLQVIDAQSQAVCQHTASQPSCEWIPVYTQRHVIHLINPGRRKARFYLVID